MADSLTAPTSGRPILRLPVLAGDIPKFTALTAAPAWARKVASAYAPAFRRRLAHMLASRELRRAELRARAFGVVAADRCDRPRPLA